MNNLKYKYFIIFLLAIVSPRNVVQDWLVQNKKFIQSPNKSINFTYSISHPELDRGYENFDGQLITTSENKFKLIMGPRTLYSDGDKWVSHDSRTNQAIIQNPDSSLFNSIVAMTHYDNLNKLLSVSILKNNMATIYNKDQKIEIRFKDMEIISILSEINSIKIKIQEIEFDKPLIISDSIFVFNENSAMMIDLRE